MNLEKFTERSREFIQAAQAAALAAEHQRILPQHLLKVILEDFKIYKSDAFLKIINKDLDEYFQDIYKVRNF